MRVMLGFPLGEKASGKCGKKGSSIYSVTPTSFILLLFNINGTYVMYQAGTVLCSANSKAIVIWYLRTSQARGTTQGGVGYRSQNNCYAAILKSLRTQRKLLCSISNDLISLRKPLWICHQ
jgi:hypothetical protein